MTLSRLRCPRLSISVTAEGAETVVRRAGRRAGTSVGMYLRQQRHCCKRRKWRMGPLLVLMVDPLARREDPLARREDPLARREDPLARREDPLARRVARIIANSKPSSIPEKVTDLTVPSAVCVGVKDEKWV